MSQHDFDIANQGFPATRADLNNALKAAVSNSAGTSAPSTTYAYQFWYDSTNNIIKMRNGDNDAWISVATVDQTNDLVSITHTGMLDLVDDDGSASIRFQAPSTVTSTTTFTLPDGDGDSGQTLLTDGSGTLAWHAPYSNRNLLYNGAYTVWQRSNSTASITGRGYHTADRWLLEYNTAGTWTQSRSTEVPSGQGFGYSLKMDCTTAQASPTYLMHAQALEGQDLQRLAKGTSDAKSVTISFWVRSNKTGNYTAELYDLDNARHISKSYTISAADTWEKKTITYAGDTSGAFGNDNNGSLIVNFWLAANLTTYGSGTLATSWAAAANANRVVSDQVNLADSTSNEWYITGVQLEEGIATPFEHERFSETLQKAMRYYEKGYDYHTAPGTSASYPDNIPLTIIQDEETSEMLFHS